MCFVQFRILQRSKEEEMNALSIFNFENNEIRTHVNDNGDVWFVGKDVCNCLGLKNSRDALARLDDDEKGYVGIADAIGRERQTTIINEAGVYRLGFTSKVDGIKKFQRFLAHEVLPSIRKTGG